MSRPRRKRKTLGDFFSRRSAGGRILDALAGAILEDGIGRVGELIRKSFVDEAHGEGRFHPWCKACIHVHTFKMLPGAFRPKEQAYQCCNCRLTYAARDLFWYSEAGEKCPGKELRFT